MNLALVLGSQGKVIAEKLTTVKDNLSISLYEDISSCIDMSIRKATFYDRILLVGNNVTEPLLRDLYEYWANYNKNASVVLICNAMTEKDLAKAFLSIFRTPLSAVMLVQTATVKLVVEAVVRTPAEITKQWGMTDSIDVEIERDVVCIPEEPKEEAVSQSSGVEEPKKKRSLFSALFGKKEKASKADIKSSQPKQETPSTDTTENQQYEAPANIQNHAVVTDNTHQYDSEKQGSVISEEGNVFENRNINDTESSSTGTISFEPHNSRQNNVYDDIAGNSRSVSVNVPITRNNTSTEHQSLRGTEPVVQLVDEGFEPLGVVASTPTASEPQVETVTEAFTDINVGASESAYRNTASQAVVSPDKAVVSNKLTALNDVYAGRSKRIIVVTGDRGTGVTTTAYSLALALSKKVDVLYVDCDVENHGLLSYIDYDNFRNYDEQHMNGVRLCKTYQLFDSCVVNWDKNMYFLTSDYSCDTTKDDLARSMEVVAERAGDFGVVIVDCPAQYLDCVTDLILAGKVVICAEATKRGFMNMLCQFERSNLASKAKRTLTYKGMLFLTKLLKGVDVNKLISAVRTVYEPDEVDWLSLSMQAFNGVYSDKLLNDVLK